MKTNHVETKRTAGGTSTTTDVGFTIERTIERINEPSSSLRAISPSR
jgi:hypothetical protein